MKKSACMLVSSLTHPIRLLTLRRNPHMLAAPTRLIDDPPQAPSTVEGATPSLHTPLLPAAALQPAAASHQPLADRMAQHPPTVEGSYPSPQPPLLPVAPQSATTSQQPLTKDMTQHQHVVPPAPGPSESQPADSSEQLPMGSSVQHQHMQRMKSKECEGKDKGNPKGVKGESRDRVGRQLSGEPAKAQHVHQSWSRAGGLGQGQGKGPMVDAQTIPARGTNAAGVSAQQLHISVRRHYKDKGKLWLLSPKHSVCLFVDRLGDQLRANKQSSVCANSSSQDIALKKRIPGRYGEHQHVVPAAGAKFPIWQSGFRNGET